MKFVKVIAVFLSVVMFSMSAMSNVVFGDFVITDEEYDPETGLVFTLLEDDTYAVGCPEESPENPESPWRYPEDYDNIPELVIPREYRRKSVTKIQEHGFENCDGFSSLVIPDTINEIGEWAFSNCYYLKEANIPDSVTELGGYSFSFCRSLEEINIPESITELKESVFQDCEKIETITIPDGIINIENEAFGYCESLRSITIPASVSNILYTAFTCCDALTAFVVDENNLNYTSIDGVLYTKDEKTLVQYPNSRTNDGGVYNIPYGTSTLENWAFYYNTSLETVVIPETVSDVGFAFMSSRIKHVNIPEGIKFLNYTFSGCLNLESVELPKSLGGMREAFDMRENQSRKNNLTIKYAGTQTDWDNIKTYRNNKNQISFLNGATIVFVDGTTDILTFEYGKNDTNQPSQEANSTVNSEDNSTDFTPEVLNNSTLNSILEAIEVIKNLRINAKENTFDVATKLCVNINDKYVSTKNDFSMDIHFENNSGEEVKPNKPVTVKIPIPTRFIDKDTFYVYHIDDDNKIEKIEFKVKGIEGVKYIVFETDKFSPYVISLENVINDDNETDSPTNPDKPDDSDINNGGDNTDTPNVNGEPNIGENESNNSSENLNNSDNVNTDITNETDITDTNNNENKNTETETETINKSDNTGDSQMNTGTQSNITFYLTVGFISLLVFMLLCLFTGKNGMSEKKKNQIFAKLISWGKRGGKLRTVVALVAIFIVLAFYYSIGMKVSEVSEN